MLEDNELLNGQLLSENNSDADIFGEDVLTGKLIANGDVVASMIAEKGDKGDAATIAIGTTTTGEPGTQAIVTNSGTSSNAVFNFTIPKGEKGDTGNTGTAATIAVGTVTTGDAGTSATITNSGTSSAAVFDFSIPKGDKGDTGSTGSAATISIGTVTTGQPGSDATVTNSGTTSAAVFDFSIPRGYDGQGAGDMLKSVYDTDNNGIVDNAEKVNNHTVDKDVPSTAVFTDENAVWGNITGTLSNQTDLKSALDKKLDLTPTRLTDTSIGTSSNPYILDTMASGYYFIETPSGSSTRYFKLTNSASGSTSISSSATGDGYGFYLYIPETIDTPNLSSGDVVCYFDRISVSSDGYASGGLICYVYDSTKSSKIALNNLKSYNRSFGKTVTGSAQTWNGIKTFNSVPVCATAPTNNSDLANKKYVDDSIPIVNDSTITIQKNSTTVDSFTTNASSAKTINISVPTDTSDLTNSAGFITNNAGDMVVNSIRTKNMFDINNITKGYVIASNGAINAAGSYCYCDYIKVKPSTTYTISLTNGNSSDPMRIAEYTSTKTFIDRPITDGNAPWNFTTPANCYFVRLSYQYINSGVLINTNIQLEEGSTATAYSEYQPLNANRKTIYNGALQGTQTVTLSDVKRFLKVYFTYAKESSAQVITYEIDTKMGKNLIYGSGIGLSHDGSNALNYYISESSYNVTTGLFTHTRAYWLVLPNTGNERNSNGGYIVYRIDTYD